MKILLDNINLSSTSGPNHFGKKLRANLEKFDHLCGPSIEKPDVQLSFIETYMQKPVAPLVLRLDGIYFDIETDFMSKNKNILRSYNMASAVVFQSNYCKELIFKYFGKHKNYDVIHNGADLEFIKQVKPAQSDSTEKFENVWSCASSWYYNNNPDTPRRWKRLKENIEFFLQYSSPLDCLVVAGNVYPQDIVRHDRIFYVGRLPTKQLYSLYKASRFFVHLASPDACPNVVIDARASGCTIICSSLGGTKEIAGLNALVVQEDDWSYDPMQLNGPRPMNLSNIVPNLNESPMDMQVVTKKYEAILNGVRNENN